MAESEYDLVVRGGTIVDGSGLPAYRADLAIKGGRMAKISGHIASGGAEELDASGCNVAPGAIDLHCHYDAQVNWDPYCSLSGWHGVTSLTIGQCGFGFAPTRPEDREANMEMMTRIEAIPMESMRVGMRWDWVTFTEYLDSLDRQGLGLNVASLFPYSPLRAWVLGVRASHERTSVTPEELERIKATFHEGMAAGAFGFSADLSLEDRPDDGSYLPTQVTSQEEYLALADVLGEFGVGHIGWTRGIPDRMGENKDCAFLEELVQRSGRPMQWGLVIAHEGSDSHIPCLRVVGGVASTRAAHVRPVHGRERVAELHARRLQHVRHDGPLGSRRRRVPEPSATPSCPTRRGGRPSRRRPWAARGAPTRRTSGRRWSSVRSSTSGTSPRRVCPWPRSPAVRARTRLTPSWTSPPTRTWTRSLPSPTCMCPTPTSSGTRTPTYSLSDGGAHTRYQVATTWPTYFLAHWVQDQQLMTVEQAHYKMSALPAWIAGFRDRGTLHEGLAADIIVYDPEKLGFAEGDPVYANDFPGGERRLIQKAVGYRYTIVNGQVTLIESEPTGALPGQAAPELRHGRLDPLEARPEPSECPERACDHCPSMCGLYRCAGNVLSHEGVLKCPSIRKRHPSWRVCGRSMNSRRPRPTPGSPVWGRPPIPASHCPCVRYRTTRTGWRPPRARLLRARPWDEVARARLLCTEGVAHPGRT